jgi:hypothetical protein
MVPSKENSTVSIPAEFYGIEVEVLVYSFYKKMKKAITLLALFCITACDQQKDTFTDIRDGKTYKTIKMPDGNVWMAENLNYEAKCSNCYDDDLELCEQCGRLYCWYGAVEACPDGWHLPSYAEWEALAEAVTKDASFNESFASLSCGYQISDCFEVFKDFNKHTSFWSGTEDEDCNVDVYLGPGSCLAFIWNLDGRSHSAKSNGHSVRCVRD